MITEINAYPNNWKKECWISSKINEISYDEEGNEIVLYSKPIRYDFNFQTISSNAEIAEFGEKVSIMKKAVIPISYLNQFKELDLAYLEDVRPSEEELENEENYGINANYRLLPPRNGNSVIIIYFEKITGK